MKRLIDYNLNEWKNNPDMMPYGIKFSINNYSIYDKVHSHPLYAIAKPLISGQEDLQKALHSLLE